MPLWTLYGLLEGKATTRVAEGRRIGRPGGRAWNAQVRPASLRRRLRSLRRSVSNRRDRRPLRSRLGSSGSKSTMGAAWSVSSASRRVRPGRLPPLSTGRWGRPIVPISYSGATTRLRAAQNASPNPARAFAAVSTSAMSTRARATAANPNCRRSTIPSTISIVSASSSRLRRGSPICCLSQGPSPTRCATHCFAPTRRCLSLDGSWRSAPARYRAA